MPSEGERPPEGAEAHEEREALRAEATERKAREEATATLNNRVALAAVVFTTLLTFVNNVRGDRQSAANAAKEAGTAAESRAAELWTYYQTKLTERTNLELSYDRLRLEIRRSPLAASDPSLRLEGMKLADYDERIHDFDRQTQQVFFRVQELERSEDLQNRARFEPERAFGRYDLASKVLTLALILLSVTIIAGRRWLLFVGIILGTLGVLIALDGYLLLL